MTIMYARNTALLGIVAMLLAFCGCSNVRMNVNAYLSSDLAFPEAGADTTIGVVVQSLPDEPLLNADIDQKVALLLQGRGYTVASPDHADYVLVCGPNSLTFTHFNLLSTCCHALRYSLKSRCLSAKRSNAINSWSALGRPRASQQRFVLVTHKYEWIRFSVRP